MFGLRVLLFLAGIALVIGILLRLAKTPRVGEKPLKKFGNMVRCAHCGTYVPQDEAVQAGDRYYCCGAHRDKDR